MIHGIFVKGPSDLRRGKLVMYRVFDPTPCLPPGATMEFEEGKYFVVLKGKRIKTGDVIEVDEDLMKLQHNPQAMMLMLAKIRAVIRGSECLEYDDLKARILEVTRERSAIPFTIERQA
jgi:hypothetical protein